MVGTAPFTLACPVLHRKTWHGRSGLGRIGVAGAGSAMWRSMVPRNRPKPKPTRKKRTREHIIADLSAHHVEGPILRCGFTADRVVHDYGVDLFMKTYNADGEV